MMKRYLLILATLSVLRFSECQKAKFVKEVQCLADGIKVVLRDILPIPRRGMWAIEVDGFPDCRSVNKPDVGGGAVFFISYTDINCTDGPKSMFHPRLVTKAVSVLTLTDNSGMKLVDTLACTYGTLFKATSKTFKESTMSQNLIYGEPDNGEIDIEEQVDSGTAVVMDFTNENGNMLTDRNVQIGDPLMFKIDVSKRDQVSQVLPETCYFSSSPDPNFMPSDGVLPFVKKSCFASHDGVVQHMLPYKMSRNYNGTTFSMPFKAFYFSNYGQNLYVHCTILACIGTQDMCQPRNECFGADKRRQKRSIEIPSNNGVETKEFIMTKYVIVEDRSRPHTTQEIDAHRSPNPAMNRDSVTMDTAYFASLIVVMGATILVLLIVVSCMAGRLTKQSRFISADGFGGGAFGGRDFQPTRYTYDPSITARKPNYPPTFDPPSYASSTESKITATVTSF